MALETIIDTVTDGEIAQGILDGGRVVRTGIIKGMTIATVNAPSVALMNALALAPNVPTLGSVLGGGAAANYVCIYRTARGIPNTGGSMARFWAHYETPGGGGTPLERFAVEDVTNLIAEPIGVFPGTAQQLRVSLTSTAPDYTNDSPPDDDRPVTANYPRVMRSLVLYGLFSNRPSSAVLNSANCVNDDFWQGLPQGYWRCEGARVRYSSRDGLYAVSVGFLTKGEGDGRDWSTYVVPRKSDGTLATVKSDVLGTLYGQDYAPGIANDTDGIGKFGFYDTANFSAIFGDDFPIG